MFVFVILLYYVCSVTVKRNFMEKLVYAKVGDMVAVKPNEFGFNVGRILDVMTDEILETEYLIEPVGANFAGNVVLGICDIDRILNCDI